MPPKRKSTGSSGPASKRAKGKGAAADAPADTPATEEDTYKPPRGKRWAAVSASANAEGDYRMVWKNEEKAYGYITLCSAWYVSSTESEDSENDEDEDDEEEEEIEEEEEENDNIDESDKDDDGKMKRLGPRCQKKHCVCFLLLSANPEHPWVISWAGFRKFSNQFIHQSLRDPDNFSMYTFNDHAGYGALEVLQNLFLDFEEAAKEKRGDGWREQWAICEAVVHWMLHPNTGVMTMIDDGDTLHESMQLVGRMFLSMLAQLDDLGLVGDATAVKSLGCTMAMYMVLANNLRKSSALDEDDSDGSSTAFQPDCYDNAVLSYANKCGVTLRGPKDIEELIADADGNVKLPSKNAKDPWGWKAEFKKYTKNQGGKIGGDRHDITTMSSAERKAANFDKKDPIKKKDMDAIKKGMVMQIA
ncbi:hypothetical protein FHL15_001696 [Xylaria flabelliformis]|uniref:Uncharacterized protein n=1 Tax=Xylaria flabelliformis TaxID=2512241 RepID=A0A553IB43_9PEZI|nr:hypothetical protein FHL15_001696 [Xylaria flabelliformis]